MLVLAIECSTKVASVALAEGHQVLGELSNDQPKSHSEFLNPAIANLFIQSQRKISEVGLVAVDPGPGSFTGARVAVSVARTIAFIQKCPVFTLPSLHLLHAQTTGDCLALINAYKNMLFVSLRQKDRAATPAEVIPVDGLETYLSQLGMKNPVRCVGDGYDAYASEFSSTLKTKLFRDTALADHPSASLLAVLAQKSGTQTLDWKSVIPLYLRSSAAEENLKLK